ncbi:MacS family sensor histidine kinase [Nocardioides gilvus]|uniref:MacS family sensor histidine kinase n=1 Tax=Nocardioides gilvus TaxID=1735589 RepID=UPI000D74C6EE|nr:DUF5931 domain-containing protein [Nocardioides gilvus]
MAQGPGPAARLAVEDRLYAALAVLRVVVTLNFVALTIWRWDNFSRPGWTLVVVLAILLWTVVVQILYSVPSRRTTWLYVADLAVTMAALATTPWLKSENFRATTPGFWVMCVVLAWAIHWNWRGGVVAGAAVSLSDVVVRSAAITQTNYSNIFLLLLGGAVVGYMCQTLQQMSAERAVAERREAIAHERARLARAVHDGVLQVLALVQRRGSESTGDWAELGVLAGEQESALRALIHAQDTWSTSAVTGGAGDEGQPALLVRDLAGALERTVGTRVTVATPGRAVDLPTEVVDTLLGAVGACLDNVRLHVGLDAPAWVLLEDHGDRVVVSVRDEGPGIAAGRLEEARSQGRLGVSSSICGRLDEIGGTATVQTGSWGTEWELSVPRDQ